MTLRRLTPEEQIVFNLIVQQREKSDRNDDSFIYSVNRGQKILQSTDQAARYGIGRREQSEILRRLGKERIIDIDWVTQRADVDNPHFEFAHHNEEYMWNKYGEDLMLWDNKDYTDSYFITINFAHIKKLRDTCIAKYLCTLSYDDRQCNFFVQCKNGKKYVIKKLKNGMPPFEVLRIALQNHGDVITRDELNKDDNRKVHIGKQSLKTQVFAQNSIVRGALKPFVELTSDSICVNPDIELTLTQLDDIEKANF